MYRFASMLRAARRFPLSTAAIGTGATLFATTTFWQSPVEAHDNTADILHDIDRRLKRMEEKLFQSDPYPHANFPTDKVTTVLML